MEAKPHRRSFSQHQCKERTHDQNIMNQKKRVFSRSNNGARLSLNGVFNEDWLGNDAEASGLRRAMPVLRGKIPRKSCHSLKMLSIAPIFSPISSGNACLLH